MAKEPDQTRWVGIRPTDPSENIPVDIAASSGCAKVEPCAAGTEFKTLTKKRTPAIGDLQAIKENYVNDLTWVNKDCSVKFQAVMGAVPAGEIWVIRNALIRNVTSMCDMYISALVNGAVRDIKCFYTIPKNTGMSWDGMIVLEEADKMYGIYLLGGNNDSINFYVYGYKIGVY